MGPKRMPRGRQRPDNVVPVRRHSKFKKRALYALAGVVFIVGLVTVVQKVTTWVPDFVAAVKPKGQNVTVAAPVKITDANFNYLVPGKNADWTFNESTSAYDKASGVVKYGVTLNNAKVNVTISQQKFPKDLQDRHSNKFMAFINDSNVVRSQDEGRGTLYFVQALENGSPSATGANTVIFATDDVLMFGQVGHLVGYDGWAALMGSMKAH